MQHAVNPRHNTPAKRSMRHQHNTASTSARQHVGTSARCSKVSLHRKQPQSKSICSTRTRGLDAEGTRSIPLIATLLKYNTPRECTCVGSYSVLTHIMDASLVLLFFRRTLPFPTTAHPCSLLPPQLERICSSCAVRAFHRTHTHTHTPVPHQHKAQMSASHPMHTNKHRVLSY